MIVEIGDAVHRVDNKKDHIGLLDGKLHLLVDLALEDILRVDDPAAGVDDREVAAAPVDFAVLAVARRSSCRVDDRRARTRQAVEQC